MVGMMPRPRLFLRGAAARHLGYAAPMLISRRVLATVIPVILAAAVPAVSHARKAKLAADETVAVKAGGLELQVPKSWIKNPPTNSMRAAEFKIPRAAGDAADGEFVVFYFGPGGGGGDQANIDRWVAQFDKKDVKVVLTQGEAKQGKYIFATISGTFNMPVGPPMGGQSKAVPNARVLGVIVKNDTGPYFLKLWGQQRTVDPAAKALRAALGAQGKEKPYKP